jgi:hypothetical protein
LDRAQNLLDVSPLQCLDEISQTWPTEMDEPMADNRSDQRKRADEQLKRASKAIAAPGRELSRQEAENKVVRDKTAKLKALRLAKDDKEKA